MIDVEPLIVRELEAFVPPPRLTHADWRDVERRAGVSRGRRGALILAAGVAAALVAVAVARSFSDFSAWLTGAPGKPATPAEQRAFDRATRSWVGFPRGTELRRLIRTRAGGSTFTLYGFRSAGSLCLRVVARGPAAATALWCAPLSDLRARAEPALVLTADYGLGLDKRRVRIGPDVFTATRAAVTVGIVADGVQQVEVAPWDGRPRRAIVAANAFIDVVDRPAVGVNTRRVWAVADGRRVAIPFAQTSFSFWGARVAPLPAARGPAAVERHVRGGAIRWLARREPRGEPVPRSLRTVAGGPEAIFSRLVRASATAPTRMIVGVLPAGRRFPKARHNRKEVCWELLVRSSFAGGCVPAGQMFSTAPFTWSVTSDSSQYVTIAGLASDDVRRMELFLATGERRPVPIHDNAYAVAASRAKYPLRLVAYDASNRVIGVKTLKGDAVLLGMPQPVDNAHWRRLIRAPGATLWVAPAKGGGTCFAVRYGSMGGGAQACPPAVWQGPPLQVGVSVLRSGKAWISGRVRDNVATVVVGTRRIRPVDGFVLAVVPPTRPMRAAALAADGHVVARTILLR